MGTFFTNVQVHTNDRSPNQIRENVIEAIRAWMQSANLVEIAETEPCDRAFLIAPATSQKWIAVYDQATEVQDTRQLEAIASTLSIAIHGFAIGILLHDGDLLELRLFQDGTKVDEFSNWAGYFSGSPKPHQFSSGQPERWRDILIPGATTAQLSSAWENQATDVEASQILERMAPIIGWDVGLVSTGFKIVPDAISAACFRLCFQQERSSFPSVQTSNRPILAYEGGSISPLTVAVGEPFNLLMVAHNIGRASQGLTIVVWGTALDQVIVEPSSIKLTLGVPEDGREIEVTLEPVTSETGVLRVATLPDDILLSEGVESPAAAFATANGNYEQGMRAWLQTRIQADITTCALRTGTASIHIGFVPTTNPEVGQTSWTIQLNVLPR